MDKAARMQDHTVCNLSYEGLSDPGHRSTPLLGVMIFASVNVETRVQFRWKHWHASVRDRQTAFCKGSR
jgi:hypothetical protein